MRLKILTPTDILLDEAVNKVIAEAKNGSFCLLPRHIDFSAILVPGLLLLEARQGQKIFFAVDEGVLIKRGPEVLVSTRHAVRGEDLNSLRQTVKERFLSLTEREKQVRSTLAKLEADFVRRFYSLGRQHRV